ncbi:MAG: TIGR00341 family protein, partial [Bacteroidia bacterium]
MRSLKVQISNGKGEEILKLANKLKAKNISLVKGRNSKGDLEIVSLSLSNNRVEEFIGEVTKLEGAEITLFPLGVMALYPPVDEAPEQFTDVQLRSPIEIFLSGLQSIGSWKGFIAYTIISSIIVWIGLFTNTMYLLVGAMLVAPFAGPAMNTAIATSRGDVRLLGRSVVRYFASLVIMIASTALLSLIMRQDVATTLMVERSQISSVVLLLALAAGAAGAVNLIQSESNSLVSGAAVGMLVAASLAPPAGIIGMAIALAKWEMVMNGIFLLFLQFLGINFSAALIFKLAGLNTKGARYERGRKNVFYTSIALTTILLAAIIYW